MESSNSHVSYHFGVEIELLLSSRSKNHRTWNELASELSARLKSAGISNHLNEDNDTSPENYAEWSIAREVTIPSQMGKKTMQWGIELVSPVFFTAAATNDGWSQQLNDIFRVLDKSFIITPSSHCSTHVHISTSPPLHNLRHHHHHRQQQQQAGDGVGAAAGAGDLVLLSIAKAILYFEPALDSLFPAHRGSSSSSSYWCQSNRSSTAFRDFRSLGECFAYLDSVAVVASSAQGQKQKQGQGQIYQHPGSSSSNMSAQNPKTAAEAEAEAAAREIVRTMCLYPASSAYGRSHGYTEDFVHGVFKWDFSGLIPSSSSFLSSSPLSARLVPHPPPPSSFLASSTTTTASGSDTPKAGSSTFTSTSASAFSVPAPAPAPVPASAPVPVLGTRRETVKRTLEFRQPPGSHTADEARTYVELAVSFVAGAIAIALDFSSISKFKNSSTSNDTRLGSELWRLLSAGAETSGIGHLGGVEKLISAASATDGRREGEGGGEGGGGN